ncbi:hypothetical protein SAMN05216570_3179 [Dyella sp. OK004]|uniref:hypothetical protein n=1 Tax=Dyella sp. OK004 TaxID=1855292 RepID=UPI0008ED18E0|nr:hypothetical protein [Dyella sp. OK004]SFS14904.1 hypothetical protein SAMN05216570_3179 [Dyella sp. OK004]
MNRDMAEASIATTSFPKHSKWGIASFALGLVALLGPLVLGLLGLAVGSSASDKNSIYLLFAGVMYGALFAWPAALLGLVLGLVAGWRPAQRKFYARLGLLLNLLFLVLFCVLIFIA